MFFIVFFSSCRKYPEDIEYALSIAGENKSQLEFVLEYYKGTNDSLKLEAAKFLISNMPGHFSYRAGTFADFVKDVIPINKMYIDINEKKILFDSLIIRHKINSIKPESDLMIISSEYLIHNIDLSFELWKKPWAEHLTFDQFCEYLLPYKYAEHQELDFWKDSLRKKMIPILNEIHPEAIENNYTYYIASLINERINSKQTPIYLPHEYGYLFYNNILIDNIIFGSCSDYSNMELAYFRANGIPSIGEEFSNRGRNRDGVISKF